MSDDIEVFLDNADSGVSYVESLARTRWYLKDTSLIDKLDAVIEAELELALIGAEKAKSEVLKASKDNIKPIK